MRKPEQLVWDAMRRHAPPEFWMERVENLLGAGMPDVHCGAGPRGHITWVELKYAGRPVRAATRMLGRDGLNPDQINWHLKAHSLRMPVFTLIRDDYKELFLVPCEFAATINEMNLEGLRMTRVAHCWPEIFSILMTGARQ